MFVIQALFLSLSTNLCFILTTLGADTFASKRICKIFVFGEHKLSRMGQKSFFREHKLSRITFFINFFLGENKEKKHLDHL